MKNRQLTPQELYALEQKARHLRALEMARLFRAGAKAVRALFDRSVTVRNAKGWNHV